jgi:uncharacterized membrane protein YjjP (DUF1212 family)
MNFIGPFIGGVCSFLSPLLGQNSRLISLIFILELVVMVVLWWLNDSKQSMIVWALRAGVAISILINIFTLPQVFGLPSLC